MGRETGGLGRGRLALVALVLPQSVHEGRDHEHGEHEGDEQDHAVLHAGHDDHGLGETPNGGHDHHEGDQHDEPGVHGSGVVAGVLRLEHVQRPRSSRVARALSADPVRGVVHC